MQGRILHIVTILTLCFTASAQVIVPMGKGLPAAPDKIAEYKKGIITAYDDRDKNIQLSYWNGFFWEEYPSPTSLKTDDEFKIIDLLANGDAIYIAIGKSENYKIYQWVDNAWSDISNNVIEKAVNFTSLVLDDGSVKCVGVFSDEVNSSNILKLNAGNNWVLEGNLITSKTNTQAFNTITQNSGKIIATGHFVDPSSSNITLAEWDGNKWEPAPLPPFLGENITLGKYNDNVVVYGTSSFEPAGFKMEINEQWRNINDGLEQYEVRGVKQFAQLNNGLIAIGSFTNINTNSTENILLYDGEKWNSTSLNVITIDQAFAYQNGVLVSGDFDDNGTLKGIGTIYNDRALVQVRVFEDKNSNCTKDANEDWLSNYPVAVNNQDYLTTNAAGIVYVQTEKETLELNAASYKYASPTCPSSSIEIDEYRTYYGTVLGVRFERGNSDASVRLEDISSNLSTPNERKSAILCVTNEGTQPIYDATLTLDLKDVNNFTSDITPNAIVNNTASWTVNVSQKQSTCFNISYQVGQPDSTLLLAQLVLPSGVEDQNELDNISEIKYKTGSTKNNHKYCENGKLIDQNSNHLSYKINFRNDKPHIVKSVVVVDELDEDVSISSRGIDATTSHKDNVEFDIDVRKDVHGASRYVIITKYKNVNLPIAETDTLGASGFLDLYINLNERAMVKGLEICNTAQIYFETEKGNYYEPIFTNEVCSTVGETLGIINSTKSPIKPDVTINPNPAKNKVVVTNGESTQMYLTLVNALGQQVLASEIMPLTNLTLSLSDIGSGVYTLYADGLFAQKIVVTK